MIYNITRSFYHGLVKHGVRIYEWTPGFCHAKISVADDCMATCGTINLDYRSLYHHLKTAALWQTARQFWISEMILQQQWMNAVKSQNSTVPDAAHICDWDSCL